MMDHRPLAVTAQCDYALQNYLEGCRVHRLRHRWRLEAARAVLKMRLKALDTRRRRDGLKTLVCLLLGRVSYAYPKGDADVVAMWGVETWWGPDGDTAEWSEIHLSYGFFRWRAYITRDGA